MNNEDFEKLTKLKSEIDRIEGMIKMVDPTYNRYRMRKLFFPKNKVSVKWGYSYGLDNAAFDLEYEDTIAIAEHFKKKLERLKLEFSKGF